MRSQIMNPTLGSRRYTQMLSHRSDFTLVEADGTPSPVQALYYWYSMRAYRVWFFDAVTFSEDDCLVVSLEHMEDMGYRAKWSKNAYGKRVVWNGDSVNIARAAKVIDRNWRWLWELSKEGL